MFQPVLEQLLVGTSLTDSQVEQVFSWILDGALTSVQIAAFVVALRAKGEEPSEVAAAVRVLRSRAHEVVIAGPTLDTCGTGGDGASSINVSTLAAFVVAGAGGRVVKHGNRAVSSRSGSADLLEALGVAIEPKSTSTEDRAYFDARLRQSVDQAGFGFFFAPRHHAALRHAAAARKELGIRTVFNLMGPLANPTRATHQLVGVFADDRRVLVANVLASLGVTAWVVHARHGELRLDEVSPAGPTRVTKVTAHGMVEDEIHPEDAGLAVVKLEQIGGGTPEQNAQIARSVLAGERSAARDVVVLNAAAALVVLGLADDLRSGAEQAIASLDRGAAQRALIQTRAIMAGDSTGEAL